MLHIINFYTCLLLAQVKTKVVTAKFLKQVFSAYNDYDVLVLLDQTAQESFNSKNTYLVPLKDK